MNYPLQMMLWLTQLSSRGRGVDRERERERDNKLENLSKRSGYLANGSLEMTDQQVQTFRKAGGAGNVLFIICVCWYGAVTSVITGEK